MILEIESLKLSIIYINKKKLQSSILNCSILKYTNVYLYTNKVQKT